MDDWKFIKENITAENTSMAGGDSITLPHTWNVLDGQDGGNDYYRGTCWYVREFKKPEIQDNEETWMEFEGVAMRGKVYVNGSFAGSHDGGYSTFRVNITEYLKDENTVAVSVDNSYTREVYPQKADFTFYGGIYRTVSVLTVPKAHFALGYYGGSGVKVTPHIEGENARIVIEAWTENAVGGEKVTFTVLDAKGNAVGEVTTEVSENYTKVEVSLEQVHLWNGKKAPYLYTLKAELESGDEVEEKFGCRTFSIDPEKGFFLNGESYPLCGAARHQDRQGVGNALTKEMHEEDMQMMLEMGANTIRMAHYQHDQYFYDLADQYGMIVWAEIPYITEHMPEGRANTISQMTELVVQNYNHPSIVCWGLSNEITATGGVTEDLVENHKILNDLCHQLDQNRPTTMAHVFMLDPEEELVMLPDIRSYNLYYGWYVGDVEENDSWFDRFHEKHPDTVMGLSEYGADANPQYQSISPEKNDYTESYQALYHEHMLKMWSERPYIWAMHVWNMFDFAADGREEGGKPGQNQKGLVTFDRKIKKDAFYIYKAYLSKEPFVHLCGSRYVDRTEKETEIKVYSNQSEVTLYVDGELVETKQAEKVFCFRVPISGEHVIEAVSGDISDQMEIRYTETENKGYICPGREVINWFDRDDMQEREGYFSIKDSVASIKGVPEAAALMATMMKKVTSAYGDVAKNVKLPEEMVRKMEAMSLETSLKQAGKAVTTEMIVELNRKLNEIKKL